MTNEKIMEGIWQATCEAELSAHLDLVDIALDKDECSYSLEEWLDMESAITEVRANLFNRVLH
jgi:hypothetical protein